jgi:hypothetical protein
MRWHTKVLLISCLIAILAAAIVMLLMDGVGKVQEAKITPSETIKPLPPFEYSLYDDGKG